MNHRRQRLQAWFDGVVLPEPLVAMPYSTACKVVRKAGIKTATEFKSWKRPKGMPSNPDQTYKNSGWESWGKFLGTNSVQGTNQFNRRKS
jgi:hypothetical protein